jgi:hypothetical protein
LVAFQLTATVVAGGEGSISIKAFKRTKNSWLFARASLILANNFLPLNVALCF